MTTAVQSQEQHTPAETVFRDQNDFDVFLEEVEESARGAFVKPEDVKRILQSLTKNFGQGLPESRFARETK